jgi:hypothetical protein
MTTAIECPGNMSEDGSELGIAAMAREEHSPLAPA